MRKKLIFIMLVASAGACKKSTLPEADVQGVVVERNTTIPVPFAKVKLLNTYSSQSVPGDFSMGTVLEVQADSLGRFTLPRDRQAELIYGETDAETHFFSPSSTAQEYNVNNPTVKISMIPYSWLRLRIQDVEPLNPEVIFVRVSLDFRDDLGLFAGLHSPDDFIFGRTYGAQSQELFYRVHTSYEEYELRSIYSGFIPPHDTLEVILPY